MRSGTSFFNGTVFKKTVLRYWPVWGAYSVIWLLALPLQGLMLLQMDDGYMRNFAWSTVPGVAPLSLGLAVVFGALCAMAVCSHLYSARSANFFGALPVKREGLFVTHYLAGLAFLIVPNLAVFLLVLLVELAGGSVLLPALLFWLAVTCGECFFFYTLAVFCGMFTGHILALPAFYGVCNVLVAGVTTLVTSVFRRFYYGFRTFGPRMNELMEWLTPIYKLEPWSVEFWVLSTGGYQMRGLDAVAVYAAAAVVLAAGSFLLYRVRRLESAGDVVSVKCMRPVFKYGVALCTGLAFGMFTTVFLNGREATLMASILIWGVAGYFAAQMLLDKSFRVFKKWKGAAAVAGVFVLLFLAVGFDATGFVTRVPTADQVDYVEFNGLSMYYLGDGGDHLWLPEERDPEFIEHVIQLHQAAVEQRDDNRPGEYTTLDLTYHLRDGSTLSRLYYMYVDADEVDQEGSAAWAVQQIYNNRDLYWKVYDFERAERLVAQEGWRLREVAYDRNEDTGYYYGADGQALYDAVKEDFLAGRIGVRRVEDWKNITYNRNALRFQFSDGENEASTWIEIQVQDTAASTLAVLAELREEG